MSREMERLGSPEQRPRCSSDEALLAAERFARSGGGVKGLFWAKTGADIGEPSPYEVRLERRHSHELDTLPVGAEYEEEEGGELVMSARLIRRRNSLTDNPAGTSHGAAAEAHAILSKLRELKDADPQAPDSPSSAASMETEFSGGSFSSRGARSKRASLDLSDLASAMRSRSPARALDVDMRPIRDQAYHRSQGYRSADYLIGEVRPRRSISDESCRTLGGTRDPR